MTQRKDTTESSAAESGYQSAMYTPEWPPNWINANSGGVHLHSAPDSVLIRQGDLLRCSVGKSASRFVAVFGLCFMVLFVAACWLGIEDTRERLVFTALGVFCGAMTFTAIYALMHHHENRGDYIVVDGKKGIVELPRHQRIFELNQILCLQLLTGRDTNDETVNHSDLNLIVAEGKNAVRHHVMGNPKPEHADAIASAICVRILRQNCPSGFCRSSDMQTDALNSSEQ